MVFVSIAVFLIACFVLVKSASYSVKSIVSIARCLKFSEFFVTFFIAGIISVTPEFLIGVNSALSGEPGVGLGTLIGSNVADLTIVIGLVALVGRKIKVGRSIIKNNNYFLLATGLPIFLMLDGVISRDDGLLLVATFILYIYGIVHKEKIFHKSIIDKKTLYKNLLIFIASMALLFLSSHFIVEAALSISQNLLIPSVLVGLFVVSIGTTLPELTFSLKAVLSKHKEVAFGDIFGNVAIDSTLSIGVLAIISPINTNFSIFGTSAIFMLFSAVLIVTLLNSSGKITRNESYMLFFLYTLFAIIEIKNIIF